MERGVVILTIDGLGKYGGLLVRFNQLGSQFHSTRGLIRSKGDPHPLEGPPTWWQWKVYARLGGASLLLWQWESWILNMPLPLRGYA